MSDECSLEELTAFLDESSNEEDDAHDEITHKQNRHKEDCMEFHGAKDKSSKGDLSADIPNTDSTENHTETPASCTKIKQLPSKEDIQAELIAMQKRMMDLQNMLNDQNSDISERKDSHCSAKPLQASQTTTVNTNSKDSSTSDKHSDLKAEKPVKESAHSNKKDQHTDNQLGNDPFGDSDSDWGDLDELKEQPCTQATPTQKTSTNSHLKNPTSFLNRGSPAVVKSQNTVKHKSSSKETDGNSWLDSKQDNKDDSLKGKEITKDLFGDSDSDWDDMDGAERKTLSSEGKTIKKLIKSGAKERISHVSEEFTNSYAERPTWKSKPNVSNKSIETSAPTASQGKKNVSEAEEKFVTDSLTGIRIVKPLISSTEMARKMKDRKLIRMSRLHLKIKTPDVQGNWVTIGVIVHKTDPKTSANGKTYTIWKMCDLEDCERVVSFFLFGQVYKEHWKTSLGAVVGLLNPSIMDNADKGGPEVAFTINNPQQLLLMGQSKELGWCRGKTRKGNPCSNFVSKKFGEFCSYHVQAAYRKASSKRSELQGSFTGTTPKSFEQKLMKSGGHFMYGGQTFLSSSAKPRKKNQDQVTVKKLQSKQYNNQNEKRVTTMSLHELAPSDTISPSAKPGSGKDETFMELVSTPSVGSMNLVKHLIKQEKTEKVKNEKVIMKSITPKELLHEHRQILKDKQMKQQEKNLSLSANKPMSTAPVLGKGFYPGSDIFLDCSHPPNILKAANQRGELSKRKAVAKVRANGGIVKENPNAVRKKLSSAQMKKRVRKSIDDEPHKGQSEEPPAKRSKLLGNVDLNSEEIKKLMKARSSHRGALAEVEAEKEEKYFDELEKKEKMEEKMLSITEIKTTVFICKQCRYTAFSAGEMCKRERHPIVRQSAIKRFFKCKDCKNRSVAITKYPIHPCRNCHGDRFERTSMVKEKTGPKLESEMLCLRGDEVKFLNSLQENVFL